MLDGTRKEKAARLLADDARDEHAAIVQYLRHAWAFQDEGLRAKLEGIARDEMWHFDWLSEKIVELGGKPSSERSRIEVGGVLLDLIDVDIKAEEAAIAQYQKHLSEIDDEGIKLLIRKIISDETRHRETFKKIKELLEGPGASSAAIVVEAAPAGGTGDDGPADLLGRLDQGVRHEYTVILKYLMQSYASGDCEAGHEIWESAIDEMKHLGWLAESLVEHGGVPKVEHTPLGEVEVLEKALSENLQEEEKVIAQYGGNIASLEDPEFKALFEKLRLDEVQHQYVFNEILEKLKLSKAEVNAIERS
ncbi:MAG: hypothetical protein HPY71_00675 [Firmicutes bacterium]|nr:hypothetical protein [Bacillota bacterium]